MTTHPTAQRILRSRTSRAVLVSLLLLGGIGAFIHAGNWHANLASVGLTFTQDAVASGSYQGGLYPAAISSDQENSVPPSTTNECADNAYISTYGDTVCDAITNPMTGSEAATPCTNGTRTTQYGDTVCKTTANLTAAAGATAQCADNTLSINELRGDTCSHHGGVAQWLQ